jgi:hypothetical protein
LFRLRRNATVDETGLITRAVSTLRASLPPAWRAEVADAPGQYDTILAISNGTTKAATFVIESKSTKRASTAQITSQLSAISEASPHPLLFATEYINPLLRRECPFDAERCTVPRTAPSFG